MQTDIAAIVQAGGVLAFAAAVWWELRAQRAILAGLAASVTALLERDRQRAETPHRGVPYRGTPP